MDLRGHRATAWSVTCNLKTVARSTVDACMDAARSLGWGVEGQLERGEEGTEHYQLMVTTPQVRFSAVKKVFPTAHIEPCKNRAALRQYVSKEETRIETLKKVQVTFLTFPQVRNKFFEWLPAHLDVELNFISPDRRLELWDEFIGLSIVEGMECDLIGMNPQHRACICKYWDSYIAKEYFDRQTIVADTRQPDTAEVSVPMVI